MVISLAASLSLNSYAGAAEWEVDLHRELAAPVGHESLSTLGDYERPPALALHPPSRTLESLRLPESIVGKDEALPSAAGKSYWIPAIEILAFQFLLNRFDRIVFGSDYDVSMSSVRRNLRSSWVTEDDPYEINQFGHPYQGSIYHGFARSAGLGYWEALAYTFAGSGVWEIAGETTPPSKNDQISTGIGGTFLGEALFRMANLVLEDAGGWSWQWREAAAAAISPPTGLNRALFGKRFAAAFDARRPAYHTSAQLGATGATSNEPGSSRRSRPNEAVARVAVDYGLPGKPGYTYDRPFDYFSFQATASTANVVESITTRGLLLGTAYEAGRRYRGIWGVYGGYDYFAPQVFRVSSTSLSIGTTAQGWITRSIALQGSLMAGVGYAAAGTLRGRTEGDYHYGVAPQGLVALRAIFGHRASIDLVARQVRVGDFAGGSKEGRDHITRAEITTTWRAHKQHGVALGYVWSRREASYPHLGERSQKRGTLGIFYTLIGNDGFGAVGW